MRISVPIALRATGQKRRATANSVKQSDRPAHFPIAADKPGRLRCQSPCQSGNHVGDILQSVEPRRAGHVR
jgi:hypothetical protein